MEKTYREDDEIQIDLMELLFALRRRIWLIILAFAIGGIGAGLYSKVILTPTYTSTAMVYVLSKETTLTSLADLQIGSQLTKDYQVVVTSRPVLEEVIENQGLETEYRDLRNQIEIGNPTDTRILSISVTDTEPVRAAEIVNEVARTSSEYIGEIMEMVPPKIIEEGVVPEYPTSPNTRRNAMIGALIGALLICGLVTLEVVLNDTIRSEEDVERYLGVSVLAAIPDKGGEQAENLKKGRGKKGRKNLGGSHGA